MMMELDDAKLISHDPLHHGEGTLTEAREVLAEAAERAKGFGRIHLYNSRMAQIARIDQELARRREQAG